MFVFGGVFFSHLPLFVHDMDGMSASFPHFPDGMPLPLGSPSETEREVFLFLWFCDIANQGVNSVGASPVALRLRPHSVFP